jgi:hypothetical protein
MPAALTFTSLQSNVVAYLERGASNDTTFNSLMPTLINQAERRISRELKVMGFVQSAQSSMTAGVWTIAKPDRWRQTISINYGNGLGFSGQANTLWTPLFPRSLEYVRAYNQDVTLLAPPKFYADYTYTQWAVSPTPDQAYPFEVVYYEMPALLDATNGTNWLTQYAPELLTYATLLECEPFLKNDERVPVWQAMYDRTKEALNAEDQNKILDRQVTRQDA